MVRAVALDEETPLGFTPAEAADASTFDETLSLVDPDGGPLELRVSVESIAIESPGDDRRPPIPSVTELRPADGLERPGECTSVSVRVGTITASLVSTDGRISETWLEPLVLEGPLDGWAWSSIHHVDTPGGTWRPDGIGRVVLDLEMTPAGPRVRTLQIGAVVGPKGGAEVFVEYVAP